ncbi:hypothetical protein Pfo_017550 [Paulownia fortunei]|nr:hypothetical protein Pfo_017550 [Paulownia fortunei]
MAFKMTRISIFVVLLAMLWEGTTAQSSCTRALTGLYPCINYINGNSSTPTSSCCSQLSSIVQSQPQCLCLLLNGAASSYGININQTLALALPGACNVQTPPVSRCNVQANSLNSFSFTVDDNSGTGSKTVPGTSGSTSDGSSITSSIQLTAFALFIAAWTANTVKF